MRFYFPDIDIDRPTLVGDAHTHAAYSLRVRAGESIAVFDGKGAEYECVVKEIKKDRTVLDILSVSRNKNEAKLSVSLYLSVIKQDRFELAVQKTTELGISMIVPVYTAYTQRGSRLNAERLNKIAISACEQCGRSRVPVIENAIDFDELLERAKASYTIFPFERERSGNIKDVLKKAANISELSYFIGPEGGITDSEQQALLAAGAHSVTLGKRILRAETAAIATLSVIYCETGEWTE